MAINKLAIKNINISSEDIILKGTPYEECSNLIPVLVHKSVSFELNNSCVAFANAIRRCLTNELELKYLTVDSKNIITNDKYIVSDIIQQRLECIPVVQTIDSDAILSINVHNDSIDKIEVMSDSIKLTSKNKNKDVYFNNNIVLCILNSNTYICVDNIHVKTSRGIDNGRVSLGTVGYEIINHDMNISSLNSEPTMFKMILETNGNFIDPYEPLQLCYMDLKGRINNIKLFLELSNIDESNYIYYTIEYGIFKLYLKKETHTIGQLLTKYIFDLCPSIDYVSARTTHPSKEEIVIDIKHNDAKKLCISAIKNIIKDLDTFISFFY